MYQPVGTEMKTDHRKVLVDWHPLRTRSAEDCVLCRGSGCPRKTPFPFFRRRRRHERTSHI